MVEHEKDKVVEEWSHIRHAEGVVSATSDQNRVVAGKETHGVAEAGDWRLSL